MDQTTLNIIVVGLSFALYFGIAIWARAGSTSEFYAAGRGVNPVVNGMATAADWMSAASFISMAGLIAFYGGYNNSLFLMGWTGGYVLMAMLLAPYLRKFGKFTVPEFIGDRYYSNTARVVAVVCLIVISVTYVIGQMRVWAWRSRASSRWTRHGPLHRFGGRVRLRGARRHEGHHLHAGGAVLRADRGLHHPRRSSSRCS
jgi:Na+(H+)/acetate symporter ActP